MITNEEQRRKSRDYAREYRKNNPEKTRAATRKWRMNNIEKARACSNIWHANNKDKQREYVLKRYGITSDQYNEILASQCGVCAICGTDNPGGRGSFHVDHCHDTGVIRGLLCHSCNRGIGYLKDNPTLLRAALSYLGGGG